MAKQLEDLLGVKFTDMDRAAKLEFLQNLRKSRRTPKATSKVVRKVKRQKKKDTDKLDALFKAMSPEEQKKFLEDIS